MQASLVCGDERERDGERERERERERNNKFLHKPICGHTT